MQLDSGWLVIAAVGGWLWYQRRKTGAAVAPASTSSQQSASGASALPPEVPVSSGAGVTRLPGTTAVAPLGVLAADTDPFQGAYTPTRYNPSPKVFPYSLSATIRVPFGL